MTEYWTVFMYGSVETICSKHVEFPAAVKAARVCEAGGGAKHRIIEVRELVPYQKAPGTCEKAGCNRKATWDVCATDGRGVLRCGRHKAGKGLTLNMRRVNNRRA